MVDRMLRVLIATFGALLVVCSSAPAQQRQPAPLRVTGMIPSGVSIAATESWQAYDFNVTNTSDVDRLARVCMFYAVRPDVQYGRDIWVPARSTLSTWMIVGPAQAQRDGRLGDIQ